MCAPGVHLGGLCIKMCVVKNSDGRPMEYGYETGTLSNLAKKALINLVKKVFANGPWAEKFFFLYIR